MTRVKKHSFKHRSMKRHYYKTKKGGDHDTDTLDALERGEKYGSEKSIPYMYNPTKIQISKEKIVQPDTQSAVEFFDKASKGIQEKTKLEEKEVERKRREELIKNTPNISAIELFSGLPPESEKSMLKDIQEYSSSEMEPMKINLYGLKTENGGRKTRRYRRKGHKYRRHRKSRKSRKSRKY